MTAERKTIDTWELHIDYGQGWEHETTELTYTDARNQRKTYRENCPQYPTRIVLRRVRKDSLSPDELAAMLKEQKKRQDENRVELIARLQVKQTA